MKDERHHGKRDPATPMRPRLVAALLALGFLQPVLAATGGGLDTVAVMKVQLTEDVPMPEPEVKLDPMASLRALTAYLTPEDINELTLYLRDVIVDVLKGTQDATLPPDLAFKLAVLEQRFRKEGDVYMQQALRNLDRDLRRFLQGLPVPVQLPELRATNEN
ncbi:MAG: hypothetical protein ACUVT2_11595 [Thiobacillaceae bacterium]